MTHKTGRYQEGAYNRQQVLNYLHDHPGSPLIEAIYRLMDAHTHAIARIVGDTEGWLSWYEHETDFGASAAHSAMIGDKAVKVRTIKQLARVVAAR